VQVLLNTISISITNGITYNFCYYCKWQVLNAILCYYYKSGVKYNFLTVQRICNVLFIILGTEYQYILYNNHGNVHLLISEKLCPLMHTYLYK